jgi:hypothetical protein
VFCEYRTTTIVVEEVPVQCQQWARSDSALCTLSMNELKKPTIIFIVCVCVCICFFVFLKLSIYKSNDFFFLKYNFYMERKHIIFLQFENIIFRRKKFYVALKNNNFFQKKSLFFGFIAKIC